MKLYMLREKLKEISEDPYESFPIRKLTGIYKEKITDKGFNPNANINTESDFLIDNAKFYRDILHKSDSWISKRQQEDSLLYADLIYTCIQLHIISSHVMYGSTTLTIN